MQDTYEVIAIHPATGKVTRFPVAASSHYEARRHAESCGLEHVVVEGPKDAMGGRGPDKTAGEDCGSSQR